MAKRRAWRCSCVANLIWGATCGDCGAARPRDESSRPPPTAVRVKDESGRIIAVLGAALVQTLNARFKAVTSQLLGAAEKAEALRKARALQLHMKMGVQQRADFADEAALFGYAHYKFRLRGITAYALCAAAAAAHPSLRAALVGTSARRPPIISSIGGGPGNDAFGAMLWVRKNGAPAAYARSGGGAPPASTSPCAEAETGAAIAPPPEAARLRVYDWAPSWGAVVARVAELDGLRMSFDVCDVCAPLGGASNAALGAALGAPEPGVFIFCYVLNEVMNACSAATAATQSEGDGAEIAPQLPSWLTFVDALWRAAKPGALFLFRDQHERAERAIVAHFAANGAWREGETYWWLNGEGEGAGEGEGEPQKKKQKQQQQQVQKKKKKKKKKKHAPPPRALAALKR